MTMRHEQMFRRWKTTFMCPLREGLVGQEPEWWRRRWPSQVLRRHMSVSPG
jgi:hypothetical protein